MDIVLPAISAFALFPSEITLCLANWEEFWVLDSGIHLVGVSQDLDCWFIPSDTWAIRTNVPLLIRDERWSVGLVHAISDLLLPDMEVWEWARSMLNWSNSRKVICRDCSQIHSRFRWLTPRLRIELSDTRQIVWCDLRQIYLGFVKRWMHARWNWSHSWEVLTWWQLSLCLFWFRIRLREPACVSKPVQNWLLLSKLCIILHIRHRWRGFLRIWCNLWWASKCAEVGILFLHSDWLAPFTTVIVLVLHCSVFISRIEFHRCKVRLKLLHWVSLQLRLFPL